MNIDIYTDFRVETNFPEDFFENLSELILENVNFYPFETAEISIVLTDDEDMKSINSMYRRINKTTDVLSFPMNEGKDIKSTMLGDVVISMETAKKQAEQAKIPFNRELSFLYIHGILHLLGFDHEISEIEEKEMFDLQENILKQAIEKSICN
jgi:probable rRNA maturation factor